MTQLKSITVQFRPAVKDVIDDRFASFEELGFVAFGRSSDFQYECHMDWDLDGDVSRATIVSPMGSHDLQILSLEKGRVFP